MDAASLAELEPSALRAMLPRFLAGYIGDAEAAARGVEPTTALIEAADDASVRALLRHLASVGDEQRLYRADPLGRDVARMWCREILVPGTVEGGEHLEAAARGPALILCNHLSYMDTTATDAVLAWAGHAALAERVVAIAGPKVYSDLFRRFAAACLNTLPAPQSAQLEGTARLGPRELARRAIESVRLAKQAIADGFIPLVYAEGSRSRTGHLRPFLKGVHRYLDVEGLNVIPAAIVGTDDVFAIEADRLSAAPVQLRFGEPLRVTGPDGARSTLEQAHRAIAALLPPERRPEPGEPAVV